MKLSTQSLPQSHPLFCPTQFGGPWEVWTQNSTPEMEKCPGETANMSEQPTSS